MPVFGVASLNNLSKCRPSLKLIAMKAIKEMDFCVLDSTRGRDAQTRAFQTCKFRGMSPPDSEMMPPPNSEN